MSETRMQIRYTMIWLSWLWIFVIIETSAIVSKQRGDTLSEHVWRWFGSDGPVHTSYVGWWWIPIGGLAVAAWLLVGDWRAPVLAAFMGWLLVHFLTGGAI